MFISNRVVRGRIREEKIRKIGKLGSGGLHKQIAHTSKFIKEYHNLYTGFGRKMRQSVTDRTQNSLGTNNHSPFRWEEFLRT